MKKNNVHKDDGKLRKMIVELLNTKKGNLKKSKVLISDINKVIIKDHLIMQLKTEYNYIKQLNDNYINYLNIAEILKKECKKNKESVLNLSKFLKSNFKEQIKIIENYENKINICKEDKETINSINYGIIEAKKKYEKVLKDKLNK